MRDMLVNLATLPESLTLEQRLSARDILIRQPIAPERSLVIDWVAQHFSKGWANEVAAAFSNQPVSCFLAQKEGELLGFACYEATARNFFGPTGVLESQRGLGLGKVLLLKSLGALKAMGYAYAIIGGVGPAAFYEKAVGAQIIEGSEISVYQNMLKS